MHAQSDTGRRARAALYHGWVVVAAAFLVAMFGFGLGFYGPGIYLVGLQDRHGWAAAELSFAVTVYYLLGATLLFFRVGRWFDRYGARAVVVTGAAALSGGLVLLSLVTERWQVYAVFAIMSAGWATMSGAAINIIVAPWFDKRRGLAVSWALNGSSLGGVVFAPLLTFLTARFGFAGALDIAAAAMLAILIPVAVLVLRPKRRGEHDAPDGVPADRAAGVGANAEWRIGAVLRSRSFVTISIPFALGLTAQVGFLTHQMAFLAPVMGTVMAGWAVSLTTFAAILGRIATGFVVDRLDRRLVACANFIVQAVGTATLALGTTETALYAGCVLFGLSVGNMTSLPGVIVQQEFPKQHFARAISLVVAINQFSFAFGPSLLGQLQQASGSYAAALCLCLAMQLGAAAVIVSQRRSAA
jgi:MFS family permease